MRRMTVLVILISTVFLVLSCSMIEKSSRHGFASGYYSLLRDSENVGKVYVNATEGKADVYRREEESQEYHVVMTFPLEISDSLDAHRLILSKSSLDIDITSILFKYRFKTGAAPAQIMTDFNVALYTGWRHDHYYIQYRKDPLGKYHPEVINRGFDFGIFAGPGTAFIGPLYTENRISDEYTVMTLQFGLAGFIESSAASFGIAIGYDYMLGPDRNVWIYQNQPWAGFIVGVALN